MSPCYYCEADDDICKTCIHSNTYEDPYEKLEAVEKQRDELLAALERIEGASMSMYATRSDMTKNMQEIAYAAIANVKEQA